jgi:hypothetical protein
LAGTKVKVLQAVMCSGMVSRVSSARLFRISLRARRGSVSRMASPMPWKRGVRPVESVPMRASRGFPE